MSDDDRYFDETANDVRDRLAAIPNGRLAVTIEKWLSRLTASSKARGANEMEYLKLLQYMIANKRIGRPFVKEPPSGRLVPLSRYIDPLPGSQRRQKNVGDLENDGGVPNADDYGGVTGTAVTSNGDDDRSVVSNERAATERDGHLAGGGGADSVAAACDGDRTNRAAIDIDRLLMFCNPCLDNLGRFENTSSSPPPPSSSINSDYGGQLSENCPRLTEAERKSACPELLRMLKQVDDNTTLQEFYLQVSLCTCDQGAMLMKVSDGMLDNFRSFATNVFETRTTHIGDGLAKEQMTLNGKYTYLRHRMLNRATLVLNFLRETVPTFNWSKYQEDSHAYMKHLVSPPTVGNDDGNGDCNDNNDDDDDDDDDDRQSEALKKLLYTLNDLQSEVTRVECEGRRLSEQRDQLRASVAESNALLSAIQCRSSSDMERYRDELTLLLQRSADQTVTVDRLTETIQLAMQNSQSPSSPSVRC